MTLDLVGGDSDNQYQVIANLTARIMCLGGERILSILMFNAVNSVNSLKKMLCVWYLGLCLLKFYKRVCECVGTGLENELSYVLLENNRNIQGWKIVFLL